MVFMKIEKFLGAGTDSDGIVEFSPSRTGRETPAEPAIQRKPQVRKIPFALRRRRIDFRLERAWVNRLFWKLKEDSQSLRAAVQGAFALLCVWIGVEFYFFAKWGTTFGQSIFVARPPGAEGFLPISALISLKYWLYTGIVNDIHPAGLFIFIAVAATGLLLKKAFCSWLCPIGTLSESLWMLGKKLLGRNAALPRWLDYILRSLKYLLLIFFVWSIVQMDVPTLRAFIYSPYNKMADVKMYEFFAHISGFALWTILALMLLSMFIKNFWCRFLCPYGALLGALSWLSPLKITRNASTCVDCEFCTRVCPSNITVHKVKRLWSDECMNCLACVEACPVKDTLDIRTSLTRTKVPNWVFGALAAGVFVGITGIAMLAGHWQNGITQQEYAKRFKEINSPLYQHNRGQVPRYIEHD